MPVPPVDDTPTAQMRSGVAQVAASGEARAELAPGSVLAARYVLEAVIGRGGTAIIYRARDRALPGGAAHRVALKVLCSEQRTDPLAIARLRREYRQMRGLSHPAIARVFDLECDGDIWFITMELVAGRTARVWLETAASAAEALPIIGACCEALEHAHALGILHGDLKPTNVMVTDDGAVKLIDFGAAPSLGRPDTAEPGAAVFVTPLYASPQILAGKPAETRDDIYSLACLSYFLLSRGRHPFGGRPSLEDGRAKSAPTHVRTIAAGLFEVIERSLSAERQRRPASVKEFHRDLIDAHRHGSPAPVRGTALVRDDARAMPHTRNFPPSPAMKTERIGGLRDGYRNARAWLSLFGVVLLIGATAAWFGPGTRPGALRAAALPSVASDASPGAAAPGVATADVRSAASAPDRDRADSMAPVNDVGVISFETPAVRASAVQSLVAITVQRLLVRRGRGAFEWRVVGGTARPGVDYARIGPQVVRFIEGQAVRTLYIPLLNTHAAQAPFRWRTFTVVLERVAGGPALGRFARVTVAIEPSPVGASPMPSPLAVYQPHPGG